MADLLTIKEASAWASEYLNRNITASNISYLIQYGRITKYQSNGFSYVSKKELINYYQSFRGKREIDWKKKLGQDINWELSFDNLREKDTTKHVHRLHPYKGKFIPQLVEYFIDDHTDNYKSETYFNKGDIILDPFCGSGTTLVEANEKGMHAIGIDISAFNVLIANVKTDKYDFYNLNQEFKRITDALKEFISQRNNYSFENELLEKLNKFNNKYFPSPEFKRDVNKGLIDEKYYGKLKQKEFLPVYERLVDKYDLQITQNKSDKFIDKWFLKPVREEIDFTFEQLKNVKNRKTKKVLTIILSRTIRSCRATTHADLATLKDPVTETYYCAKHKKICKPLFSILSWWERYGKDTINRLSKFNNYRTNTNQICLKGDARTINIEEAVERSDKEFGKLLNNKKIKGVFSSPPYVGLINYHEQHAYSYDLFGFERNDELEIGPLFKGKGQKAKKSYIEGIAQVLNNSKKYLAKDYNIFLVANDRYNMYPTIAKLAGMKIVNKYKRPVLNRTEKDKGAYSEIIFHLKSE